MNNVIEAVVNELKDKNPGMDVLKMCIRVAIATSEFEYTENERIEIFNECSNRIGFDPLEPALLLKTV